jgi:hypothetical protein
MERVDVMEKYKNNISSITFLSTEYSDFNEFIIINYKSTITINVVFFVTAK